MGFLTHQSGNRFDGGLFNVYGRGALLKELKREGFETALYTGRSKAEVPEAIRKYLNYLKTGEFILSQKTSVKQYVGSWNQQFDKVA